MRVGAVGLKVVSNLYQALTIMEYDNAAVLDVPVHIWSGFAA